MSASMGSGLSGRVRAPLLPLIETLLTQLRPVASPEPTVLPGLEAFLNGSPDPSPTSAEDAGFGAAADATGPGAAKGSPSGKGAAGAGAAGEVASWPPPEQPKAPAFTSM